MPKGSLLGKPVQLVGFGIAPLELCERFYSEPSSALQVIRLQGSFIMLLETYASYEAE